MSNSDASQLQFERANVAVFDDTPPDKYYDVMPTFVVVARSTRACWEMMSVKPAQLWLRSALEENAAKRTRRSAAEVLGIRACRPECPLASRKATRDGAHGLLPSCCVL